MRRRQDLILNRKTYETKCAAGIFF